MRNIMINGAHGKMGRVAVAAIEQAEELTLVGQLNKTDDLAMALQQQPVDIVIDFTTPQAVYQNTQVIIAHNVHPVIGSTGLTAAQITKLQQACATKKLGGIIAPNFSLAAALMLRYAADAAKYLPSVEIIEMHHSDKKDAPSGTALQTAHVIQDKLTNQAPRNIPIHAVRLPGVLCKQQVIFANSGETLTIEHQAINREAFMPGLLLACQQVTRLDRLVYGLESLLA